MAERTKPNIISSGSSSRDSGSSSDSSRDNSSSECGSCFRQLIVIEIVVSVN